MVPSLSTWRSCLFAGRRRWLAVALLLSGAFLGCRKSDGREVPRADGADVRLALCETFARCGEQWGPSFSQVSECVRTISGCDPESNGDFFLSGTEEHVADCALEIRAIECEDHPQISLMPFHDYPPDYAAGHPRGAYHELIEVAPSCSELMLVPGSMSLAAVGENCRARWCGEFDTYCASESVDVCVRNRSLGQSCDWELESDICGHDLTCSGIDTDGVCQPLRSFATLLEGEECGAAGTSCRSSLRCLEGRCTRLLLEDSPCGDSNQCALDLACLDGSCQPFDYCSDSVGLNEPCYFGKSCRDGLYCDIWTVRGDTRTLCHAYVEPGEPCVDDDADPSSRRCVLGHGCVMGNCEPLDLAAGESCLENGQCQSYVCIDGLCLPEDLPGGASCAEDRQCDSFLCEEGACLFNDLGNGEVCQRSSQCRSFACREGVCVAE